MFRHTDTISQQSHLSCPPPIYRPCQQADKSAVGTINRPLHTFFARFPTTFSYTREAIKY